MFKIALHFFEHHNSEFISGLSNLNKAIFGTGYPQLIYKSLELSYNKFVETNISKFPVYTFVTMRIAFI